MIPVYLLLLFAGLAIGAVAMWRGIERRDPHYPAVDQLGRELPALPVSLAPPMLAGGLLCVGVVGYEVTLHEPWGSVAAALLALAAGACGAVAAMVVVTRWAVPSALATPEDPRYSLQGTPAIVLASIDGENSGTISYHANGQSVMLPARTADAGVIPAGVDVVIERIEDGVAFVELWAAVEARL